MKKYILLSWFLLSVFALNAQSLTNLYPEVAKKRYNFTFRMHPVKPVNASSEIKYLYRTSTVNVYGMMGIPKNLYYDYVYKIEGNGKIRALTPIIVPTAYRLQDVFETENEIVTIYYHFEDNQCEFYLNSFTKDKPTWKPKQFAKFSYQAKDQFLFSLGLSPDKSKIGLSCILVDKKRNLKGIAINVYDNEGTLLWENTVSPEFNNKTFSINGSVVSNEGKVYLSLSSFTSDKRKTSDENIHLIEVSEADFKQFDGTENIGYINSAGIQLLKNGNVVIAGYYLEKAKDDNAKGCFSMYYDAKNQSITNFSHSDFPSVFKKSGLTNLSFDYIFEMSDGSLALLGEQRFRVIQYTQNGSSYIYNANNIVYTSVTKDGIIEDFKTFTKRQMLRSIYNFPSFDVLGLSYHVFEKEGHLCLLYNDNVNNTNIYNSNPKSTNPYMSRKNAVRLVEINGNDITSKSVLMGKTYKKTLNTLVYGTDDYIIITGLSKYITIDKIKL